MRQVGHADSKMTMDAYAQLQQPQSGHTARRSTRSCGARERLYGAVEGRNDNRHTGERGLEDVVNEWRDETEIADTRDPNLDGLTRPRRYWQDGHLCGLRS